MPFKEQAVTNGASVVLAQGPCNAIIKNKTGTAPLFLAMGSGKYTVVSGGSTSVPPVAVDNGTCYQWDPADGPLGLELVSGAIVSAIVQAAGAAQTVHVLTDR